MKLNKNLNLELIKITILAGKAILKVYKKPFKKNLKADKSPITEADIAANDIICSTIKKLTPDIPIISEENDIRPKNISLFWLVDPLDGTKEFIKKNGEFTVNIALVKNKKPIYGIIFKPTSKELFFTEEKFSYYSKLDRNYNLTNKVRIRTKKRKIKILTLSRSHSRNNDLILKKFNANKIIQTGSSIKLCLIANGSANIYPRLGTTMEWDIAAGDAILRKAGGKIKTLDGKILKYGKKNFKNSSFIARS
jgi:3'(2'),5'-bisphosphate nucleotidase